MWRSWEYILSQFTASPGGKEFWDERYSGTEFAFGKVKAEFEENGFKTKIEENEGAFGVDVRTGLLWKLDQQWGIFTEYRFTYLNYNSEDSDNFVCIGDKKDCPESIKLEDFEAKLTTHHFLMGLSYRF